MAKYLTIPTNFNNDEFYRFRKMNEIIQKIIIEQNSDSITILDVGSGDGQFLSYIKSKCTKKVKFDFIGIDKYVNKKFFDFKLLNNDIEEKLPIKSNSIDIVIAGEIIEHVKNTDLLINELKRVIKKNGSIVLSTPNLGCYLNRFLLLLGYQPYHSEVSDAESGFGQDLIYKILGRPKIGNKTAGHLRMFTYRAFVDFVYYYKLKLIRYYPVYFSSFRSDNKRTGVIKFFFFFDQLISKLFPQMSSGMIFHLTK